MSASDAGTLRDFSGRVSVGLSSAQKAGSTREEFPRAGPAATAKGRQLLFTWRKPFSIGARNWFHFPFHVKLDKATDFIERNCPRKLLSANEINENAYGTIHDNVTLPK